MVGDPRDRRDPSLRSTSADREPATFVAGRAARFFHLGTIGRFGGGAGAADSLRPHRRTPAISLVSGPRRHPQGGARRLSLGAFAAQGISAGGERRGDPRLRDALSAGPRPGGQSNRPRDNQPRPRAPLGAARQTLRRACTETVRSGQAARDARLFFWWR